MGFGPDLLAQTDISLLHPETRVARVAFRSHDQVSLLLPPESPNLPHAPDCPRARLAPRIPNLADPHDPDAESAHSVVVGDWVLCRLDHDPPSVSHRFGRRSLLRRRDPGGTVQPVGANLDLAVVCMAMGHDLNLRRFERWLAVIRDAGVPAMLLLTKADAGVDVAPTIAAFEAVSQGVPVLPVSAAENRGRDALISALKPGSTIALLGASGVGKSTLINWIAGRAIQEVGEVRSGDDRGRHTTTARELIAVNVPGGFAWILDNPGVRQVGPVDATSVDDTYPEVVTVLRACRFRDCRHSGDQGCAVPQALDDGRLEPARWRSYQKLQRELAWAEDRDDPSAMATRRAGWKRIHQQAAARNQLLGKGRR